jgi:hypothetical protein
MDETHADHARTLVESTPTTKCVGDAAHACGGGLAFRAAIDPIIDQFFKTEREPEEREPREAYRARSMPSWMERGNGLPMAEAAGRRAGTSA